MRELAKLKEYFSITDIGKIAKDGYCFCQVLEFGVLV